MTRQARTVSLLTVSVLAMISRGAEPTGNLDQASALVGEALQAEMVGDLLSRERLLCEAKQLELDFAPANWYTGRVRLDDGKWITVDEVVEQAKSNKLFAEYEAMRAQQPASVQGNWQAAQWCANQDMAAQCRAHLENILMLDHDNVSARKALGHQLVGNDWLTPQDQLRLVRQGVLAKEGFEKYQTKVFELVKRASQGNPHPRQKVWQELKEIDDPLAIPVIVSVLGRADKATVLLVVDWLDRIDHQQASLALARMAVFTEDNEIRNAAIAKLKHKPLYDFVPDMLKGMSSPIMFAALPVINRDGSLGGFKQVFAREGMDDFRLLKFDTTLAYQNVGLARPADVPIARVSSKLLNRDASQPFGQRYTWQDTNLTRTVTAEDELAYEASVVVAQLCDAVAKMQAVASVHIPQANAMLENRQINQGNRRIADVIGDVVDAEFTEVPRDVWDWWDRYNETNYQRSKHLRRSYASNYISMPRFYSYDTPGSGLGLGTRVYKASCFVAGTKVNTLRGLRNIEDIMPGDLVLCRNVATGELGYQPVVCGTTRDPSPTVILRVDDEMIHATSSHLLWVSGKGWTKAGEIKPGDLLHSADVPAVVMSTSPGPVLPTHNLVVADMHTYFVGSSRILSHDVLPRGSVHEQIPGQFHLVSN